MRRLFDMLLDGLFALLRVLTERNRPGGSVATLQARVPSRLEEAYFTASVRAVWAVANARITADRRWRTEQRLRDCVRQVACQHSVLEVGEAETAVNLALQDLLPGLGLVAAEATLTAEQGGRELAEQMEALSRETALAEAAQRAKLDQLRVLGERVLPDPALARLWWMDGRPDKLTAMVEMDHVFERAAALVRPHPDGGPPQDPVPGLINEFLRGLGPQHRDLLLRQLHQIFLGYERSDLADMIDLGGQASNAPRPRWTKQPEDLNGQVPGSHQS
ncbi:hypothetical protein ABZ801_04890 [Actinomadura sp. NPDC047616]|uniref:hypothetical protein n=1 Tax=Actinomadura sp. NPDC047616 TaxID=3155914 RepID=UPI0033F2283B